MPDMRKLLPWQEDIVRRILAGERITLVGGRAGGKTAIMDELKRRGWGDQPLP